MTEDNTNKPSLEEIQISRKYERKQLLNSIDNKKVLSSWEIKCFLEEDLEYEVKEIEKENALLRSLNEDLISMVGGAINKKFGKQVKVYGSYETGLNLPKSNIDLAILVDED